MKTLALRALAWFTWHHIQWLLVQCLNDDGLYHALYRVSLKMAQGPFMMKTYDSVTLAESMKELKPK